MNQVNDFHENLDQSHAAADLPFWRECYAAAFPTMIAMHDHREDGDHQRQGIDRSVVLRNSKVVYIDEKVRGRNRITGRVYEDIALEEYSDMDRKKPGWVLKPLLCDYIAYAIAPLGKCYLLPVLQLQTAWLKYSSQWKENVSHPIVALNNGYRTLSWPVTPRVLFPAIGECLRLTFTPCELDNLKKG